MLITKKYIKMCKQAKRLQELWKPSFGDWILFNFNKKIFIINDEYPPVRYYRNESIWILRLEQLVEMVFPSKDLGFINKLDEIYSWLFKQNHERRIYRWLRSWNELLLAFVMYKKYSEFWDGKTWVKGT